MIKAYATDAFLLLGNSTTAEALGRDFGATLTEAEVRWLMTHAFARHASDVIWRCRKLAMRMNPDEVEALEAWMQANSLQAGRSHGFSFTSFKSVADCADDVS